MIQRVMKTTTATANDGDDEVYKEWFMPDPDRPCILESRTTGRRVMFPNGGWTPRQALSPATSTSQTRR